MGTFLINNLFRVLLSHHPKQFRLVSCYVILNLLIILSFSLLFTSEKYLQSLILVLESPASAHAKQKNPTL